MIGLHWLASSERERQRAMELVRALQQKESRDELGIGTVRDAIADRLFPGTSTLHTRARYHLFVPWAYMQAAGQQGSASFGSRVRACEAQLIHAIRASGHDLHGLIGRDAGAALKRMPSTLYWQGLQTWGIRQASGPQSVIDRLAGRMTGPSARDDDGQVLDPDGLHVWHRNLPRPPAGFPQGAAFALTREEAEFLVERLRTERATRDSALPQLATMPFAHEDVEWIWEHPGLGDLDPETRHVIEQGRRFSLLMHGASWLYNVILARMLESDPLEDGHRDEFAAWAGRMDAARDTLVGWDLQELWATVGDRVPGPTRLFVGRWQELVLAHGPAALVDREDARALVVDRERRMKKAAARTANQKALKQWGGASGTSALDFRWKTARGLLADIRRGLAVTDA